MQTYLRDKLKRYKKAQIILFVVYPFISIGIIAFEEFKLINYLNIILFTLFISKEGFCFSCISTLISKYLIFSF